MNENIILKKNPNIVHRLIGEETVLVPILKTNKEMDCIYTLNKSAAFVWDMLDGKKTMSDVKKRLLKEFDSTENEIDKELGKVIKDLEEAKAIC